MNADSAGQLIEAFSTIFLLFAVGYVVQRLRPFGEETLNQLARLVFEILLPVFLFYATATTTTASAFSVAPGVIALGVVLPLVSLLMAVVAGRLARVETAQVTAFRFSAMVGNTAFLGIPVCTALLGTTGAVYAVLYDFGTTLVVLTVGVWVVSGGKRTDWRSLVGNPLILSVIPGLHLPDWIGRPCETLGGATLPMALLVGGAQLGGLRARVGSRWQPVAVIGAIRLVSTPLVAMAAMHLVSAESLMAGVVVLEAGMPVGLTTAILARSSGADSELAASAILWTTVAAIVTLPLWATIML